MTIGEKIRYLRERMGITQAKLAEVAGLHPVSIRKYETNKMQPQKAQIERIAKALNISPIAILGIDYANMKLETYGDLMGIIMILHNSKVIIIDGVRDEKDMLKPETVQIKINPLLKWVFESNVNGKDVTLDNISFTIKSQKMLSDLLIWENMNNGLLKYSDKSNLSELEKSALAEISERKEAIEIELQRSTVMLDMEDGIKVKILPDFS